MSYSLLYPDQLPKKNWAKKSKRYRYPIGRNWYVPRPSKNGSGGRADKGISVQELMKRAEEAK